MAKVREAQPQIVSEQYEEGLAVIPGAEDHATILSRTLGIAPEPNPSEPVDAVTPEDLVRLRGATLVSNVRGFVPLGDMARVQQLPPTKDGPSESGLIAKFALPSRVVSTTGIEPANVSFAAKAYQSDWMPGKYGLQLDDGYNRRRNRFNPNGTVTQPIIVARPVTTEQGLTLWQVAELLQDNLPGSLTGGVNFSQPGKIVEDPDRPGWRKQEPSTPIIDNLSLVAQGSMELFNDLVEQTGLSVDEIVDTLIEAYGRHIDPRDPFDYRIGDERLRVPGIIQEFIDNWIFVSSAYPFSLAAPMIARREYLRIEERRKNARYANKEEYLDDERIMEQYKRALRQEVMEAYSISTFRDNLKVAQASLGMNADPIRWTAQLITANHLQVFAALAIDGRYDCSDEANDLFEKYKRYARQGALLIKGTDGNTLTRAMTYKSGQHAEIRQLPGNELLYVSGSGDLVEVHDNAGAFPLTRFQSVTHPEALNQLHGMIGVIRANGRDPASLAAAGMVAPEEAMFIDGRLAPSHLVRGAMHHFAHRQRMIDLGAKPSELRPMPFLHELLLQADVEPTISITVPGEDDFRVAHVLGRGSGIGWWMTPDGLRTKMHKTIPLQDYVPRPRPDPTVQPTTTAVETSNKSWFKKGSKNTVVAATPQPVLPKIKPTYSVIPNPDAVPRTKNGDVIPELAIHEDDIPLGGLLVLDNPGATVYVRKGNPELKGNVPTLVGLNDKTLLSALENAMRTQARKHDQGQAKPAPQTQANGHTRKGRSYERRGRR